MMFVRDALSIHFAEATRPWLELRDLLRVATSQPTAEMQASPLVLDRADDKMRIILSIRAVGVERETGAPLAQAIKDVRSIIVELDRASPFPPIDAIRYDVVAIEPFDMPFHELVTLMKGYYLKPTRIAEGSSDIALVFDQREDGLLKHLSIGPMDKAQLTTDVLKWPRENLPETFIYINVAYESTDQMGFAEDALKSFLNNAVNWQEQEIESLVKELKEASR